jgi:hypothetical protein
VQSARDTSIRSYTVWYSQHNPVRSRGTSVIFRPLSSPTDHVATPASVRFLSGRHAGFHIYLQPVYDPRYFSVDDVSVHVPVESTTTLNTDSTDLHDVALMTSDSSDGSYATTDEEDEEDDADYLEPEDIRRQYWRNGNLDYGYVGYTVTALHDVTLTLSQFQFRRPTIFHDCRRDAGPLWWCQVLFVALLAGLES